jgi:hypothetical protein
LFHQHDTQKVEGFNKLLTKFLQKDKTHCQTIENEAKCHLAVGIQSVGCVEFHRRIFELTGIVSVDDDVTSLFLGSEQDQDKLCREAHRRKKSVKTRRMRDQMKKTRDGVEKLKNDDAKALFRESGMMGPGAADDVRQGGEEGDNNAVEEGRGGSRVGVRTEKRLSCKHCGGTSHARITNSFCPKNPKKGEVTVGTSCASEMKSWEGHMLPVQPNHARVTSRTDMCVETAEGEIRATGTIDTPVDVCDETEAQGASEEEDSGACLNREILALERRDFDDEEGIDSDPEEDN